MHTIEDAARKLAEDKIMMEAYEKAENNNQNWFFTKNQSLGGAVRKPLHFPSKDSNFQSWWRELHPAQKQILYTFGNFFSWWTPFKEVSIDEYEDIKAAYNKWPLFYYGVYYGAKIWSCNLFVGETLFIYGRKVMKNGMYFSAHEIWEGFEPFSAVKKDRIKPGNIVAMWGHHVEIVTSVNIKNGTFCSRGAGRRVGDGVEKCEQEGRKINSSDVKFFTI